jgi:hypothetical protein
MKATRRRLRALAAGVVAGGLALGGFVVAPPEASGDPVCVNMKTWSDGGPTTTVTSDQNCTVQQCDGFGVYQPPFELMDRWYEALVCFDDL